MTLNITVASRWMAAQSSDFRLIRSDTREPTSETAQKQIVLHYVGWSGLLCYTGVAQWGRHDTAEWLERVLVHELGQRTLEDVLDTLITEGNRWLTLVPQAHRRHTFTLLAFVRGIPRVHVISNYQWVGGCDFGGPLDEFRASKVRPRSPRCFVTGCIPAMPQGEKKKLEGKLSDGSSEAQVRYAVAVASREAARRARDMVSEACVVAHLRPDGSGEAQVFGNLAAPFLPVMISNGVNVATWVPGAADAAGVPGPHRLVGVTWTSDRRNLTAMVGAFRSLANQTGDGWPPPP